ncbi:dCTP deaminase [Candidatus Nesciobacter abundans]|uniref:dCTP deaminase n=1 Tax=Candidatus Nesciobacter abundans TaxID=2601668 RepID=A0A5C0UHL0_9PROT|nr:dCTP deaminase [Candidatus Nesciobacter abundans]QEK39217.1 dCTP deaminase [Candidatus Nesciobacter abundans]
MILNDSQIKELSKNGMISNFSEKNVCKGVISFGLSSFGYDARLSNDYKICTNTYSTIIDPKNFDEKTFIHHSGETCLIPPGGFVLCMTMEKFKIPNDVLVICVGKSTYARCGLIVNVTPLEPGWEGYVTLELSNTSTVPIKVYSGEGICQFLFFKGDKCSNSYKDKSGKYMHQEEITFPKIKN